MTANHGSQLNSIIIFVFLATSYNNFAFYLSWLIILYDVLFLLYDVPNDRRSNHTIIPSGSNIMCLWFYWFIVTIQYNYAIINFLNLLSKSLLWKWTYYWEIISLLLFSDIFQYITKFITNLHFPVNLYICYGTGFCFKWNILCRVVMGWNVRCNYLESNILAINCENYSWCFWRIDVH